MKKKQAKTPVSHITSALRRIWLWSPQRREVVKRANHHCEECGCETRIKKDDETRPKMEIHHLEPCDLTKLSKKVHAVIFPGADKLLGLCQACHKQAEEVLNNERLND